MNNSNWGSIYKELGLEPIINATGSVTALGGSIVAKEVQEGMDLPKFSNGKICPAASTETGLFFP